MNVFTFTLKLLQNRKGGDGCQKLSFAQLLLAVFKYQNKRYKQQFIYKFKRVDDIYTYTEIA